MKMLFIFSCTMNKKIHKVYLISLLIHSNFTIFNHAGEEAIDMFSLFSSYKQSLFQLIKLLNNKKISFASIHL
jgi:hypothetical protein